MNEKIAQALDEISGVKIAEAAGAGAKRKRRFFLAAVAAILAVVLIANIGFIPGIVTAQAVSTASDSRTPPRPDRDDYASYEDFRADIDAYNAEQSRQEALVEDALAALMPFFAESTSLYIADFQENRVWSPINAYIALATLAEVTDGESSRQVLAALGAESRETLREQAGAVWEAVYKDDGNEICVLANSLWLHDALKYNEQTMDDLAYYYYTSVYRTDLRSARAADDLKTWLNNNTGGLLKKNIAGTSLPEEAVLVLASTVYLQAKWADEFSSARNTTGVFHAPGGDTEATYMNKEKYQTYYYWGDSYGAVALSLKNGCRMWFFLPDEDKTLEDVLTEGQYLEQVIQGAIWQDTDTQKYMKVNLSVPKFDISSSADLTDIFRTLGITDIFNEEYADFTAITSDSPVTITAVNQAARVIIDEQGVKAASYIEIPGAGAAAPPEEIIDFILDRPFLFVIATSEGVPLFTGAVNNP